MPIEIIILAAGVGKRMKSSLPKVLHTLGGKPLLAHVIETAQQLKPHAIHVVVGHSLNQVKKALSSYSVNWIEQSEQLGTGHAVQQALSFLKGDAEVLILAGDVPLVSAETLQALLERAKDKVGVVTTVLENPTGYGRVLRDVQGMIVGVVEEKDASFEQKKINEVNTGIIATSAQHLKRWLPHLKNENAQKEYYLPDILLQAREEKVPIESQLATHSEEVQGVNDLLQLAELERYFQQQQAEKLLLSGVRIIDPNRFDLRGMLLVEAGVVIEPNVILEGKIKIGRGSVVGSNCYLRDVEIGDHVVIKSQCVLEECQIGDHSSVGPFARLRPGTKLAEAVHIGNFVEVKNSEIAAGSKANHLAYVGDATIGKEVNIGAGTITCNYDGANKHRTTIGDGAFIGSNASLVAPVSIGENATIGAGSTISREAPAEALTLTRAEQKTIKNWKRPKKLQTK